MFFFTNEKIGADVITLSCYSSEEYIGMIVMKIATCSFNPFYVLSPGRC